MFLGYVRGCDSPKYSPKYGTSILGSWVIPIDLSGAAGGGVSHVLSIAVLVCQVGWPMGDGATFLVNARYKVGTPEIWIPSSTVVGIPVDSIYILDYIGWLFKPTNT